MERGVGTAVLLTSNSSGSSSLLRLGCGTNPSAGGQRGAIEGAPSTFDRSGERSALSALHTLLRSPPDSVEDDPRAQAWLEGLICMTDYASRCNDAVLTEANRTPERTAVRTGRIQRSGAFSSRPRQATGGGPSTERRHSGNRAVGPINQADRRPAAETFPGWILPNLPQRDLHHVIQGKGEPLQDLVRLFRRAAERIPDISEMAVIIIFADNVCDPILRTELHFRVVSSNEEL